MIDVPLSASDPGGETIGLHVKRFRPEGGTGAKAMWMLQGGPGASAYGYERLVEALATKFTDLEFYLPDHRGTGQSARIGCPAEKESTSGGIYITPAEWPRCLAAVQDELGDRLAQFNTTNAANDLGVAIDRTRRDGQKVFVYGASYGTYWAHRYLQLFPRQSDGVILDSIAPPGISLARQDQDADEAARDFFAVCAKDDVCRARLGDDPYARVQSTFAKLKAGHCADLTFTGMPAHVFFRRIFGNFLMSPVDRAFIPAIAYRLDRCSPADVAALDHFIESRAGVAPPEQLTKQWGWVLSNNIAFSELWEQPSPTAKDLDDWREALIASRDVTSGMDANVGKWPTYAPDEHVGRFAVTDTPMLMLAGGLDPATLLRKSLVMKEHFAAPTQHFVVVPTATHGVIGSSTTSEGRSCGTRMMMAFTDAPTAPALDTSCIADVVPIAFAADAATSTKLFGTPDLWD